MTFLTYFRDAWSSIVSNKLRSSLSMLGIVIGVSSVIVLMALGAGAQQGIMDQMGSLINNNISISTKGGTTVYTNDDVKGYVKAITLTPELADEIEQAFPQLSGAVTYGSTTIGNVANGNNSNMASFAGVPIDYFIKMQSAFSQGENFNASDFENSSDVAIINKNVVEMLFTNKSPLGEKVTVSNRDYTVIWVLDESSVLGMVYIPLTTYQKRVSGKSEISAITVKLNVDEDNALWQARIQYFLLRKYNVKHLDLAGFSLSSTAAIGGIIDSMMVMFQMLLGAIGGISLLVGGIGVMNIMLVSVTERTREIWIRKAIGALNKDIVQQFLIEAIVVTFIWGLIAIGISLLVAHLINGMEIEGLTMQVTPTVVITAFTLTILVGILSGILPANRAANLKPIDALRFE